MSFDPEAERERELVQQIGLVFENAGLPPIAGRIVGHLLLCDPPHQSSSQLADRLHASRGSISTTTRMLVAAGIIEKVRFPGSRATWFRIAPGCWTALLHAELARAARLRRLGDDALAWLEAIGAPPERAARIREFRDFNAFFEHELPRLLERWEHRSDP